MAKEYDRKFPFWDGWPIFRCELPVSFRECTPKKRGRVQRASVAEAFAASWFGAFILSFGGSQTSSDGLYRRRWLSSSLGPRQRGRLQTRLWRIQGGRRGSYPALISNTTPYFLRRRFKLSTDSRVWLLFLFFLIVILCVCVLLGPHLFGINLIQKLSPSLLLFTSSTFSTTTYFRSQKTSPGKTLF